MTIKEYTISTEPEQIVQLPAFHTIIHVAQGGTSRIPKDDEDRFELQDNIRIWVRGDFDQPTVSTTILIYTDDEEIPALVHDKHIGSVGFTHFQAVGYDRIYHVYEKL